MEDRRRPQGCLSWRVCSRESPCSLFESGAQRQCRGREHLGGAAMPTPMSHCDGTGWGEPCGGGGGVGDVRDLFWGEGSLLGMGTEEKRKAQE